MAREKVNGSGTYVWGFSIDRETHRMIKEISRSLGIRNESAVVRMAVRRLYNEVKA